MKKLFASISAIALAICSLNAQDLAQITELYNTAAANISIDKASALTSFQQALSQAEALGDEGAEIATNCKDIIPSLCLSIAKELANDSDYDASIAKLNEAIDLGASYGKDDVVAEAADLIPQIAMQKAGKLFNAKDYEGAAEAYKEVLASDSSNGTAALRLGAALNALGKVDEAKEAFNTAIANGQEKAASKQLSNIALKAAAAALKEKNYDTAVSEALECVKYEENATAYQIAGQASQLSGDNTNAITYFEKYLELKPDAKNAGQIAYTVGALYQQAKNNTKAKEYYQKASTDPTYGAEATKLLNALK